MATKSVRLRVIEMDRYAPGYDDPADFFHRHPDASQTWQEMVTNAKPIKSWMVDRLDRHYDLATPGGQADAATEMYNVLLHAEPIERGYHLRELANKIGAHEDDVREHLNALWLATSDDASNSPVQRAQPIVLDKYGEALGFACTLCGERRTHYSEPLGIWRCWNCDEVRHARNLATLQRNVDAAIKRRRKPQPVAHKPRRGNHHASMDIP